MENLIKFCEEKVRCINCEWEGKLGECYEDEDETGAIMGAIICPECEQNINTLPIM